MDHDGDSLHSHGCGCMQDFCSWAVHPQRTLHSVLRLPFQLGSVHGLDLVCPLVAGSARHCVHEQLTGFHTEVARDIRTCVHLSSWFATPKPFPTHQPIV
jgi:hypothetical protein